MVDNIKALFEDGSMNWQTPERYVKPVHEVLGFIGLDPASSEEANKTVKAIRYFDEKDDGLSQSWISNTVFLNPPYGRGHDNKSRQEIWVNKLLIEFSLKNFQQGILLVNSSTSEKWFQPLFQFVICFTNHRIHFDRMAPKSRPTKGNAFVYMGHNKQKFCKVFSAFGSCVSLATF